MATTKPINRVALFKIKDEKNIPYLVDKLREMGNKAVKDGKSYITSLKAGAIHKDERNKGYNFAIFTTFETPEDHKFYDAECEAHKEFKEVLNPHVEDRLPIYFEDEVSGEFIKLTPHD